MNGQEMEHILKPWHYPEDWQFPQQGQLVQDVLQSGAQVLQDHIQAPKPGPIQKSQAQQPGPKSESQVSEKETIAAAIAKAKAKIEALKAKDGKPRPSKCEICGTLYPYPSHFKRKHSKECPICKKVFSRRDHMIRHKEEIHKILSCPDCGEIICGKDLLKIHMLSVHSTNPPKYKCEWCEKSFKQEQSLTRHNQEVHLGRHYECSVCDATFTRKDKLDKHEKDKHKK